MRRFAFHTIVAPHGSRGTVAMVFLDYEGGSDALITGLARSARARSRGDSVPSAMLALKLRPLEPAELLRPASRFETSL
jgi:hypothetical protein